MIKQWFIAINFDDYLDRPFGDESRMAAPLFEYTEPLYNNNNAKKVA